MLIGTSLGRCMVSILSGEVNGDHVGLIITRTRAETFEDFMTVVKEYYDYGNRSHSGYNLGQFDWDNVEQLAHNLWYGAKIHQPRNFDPFAQGYLMPEMQNTLWMEVVPTNTNSNPSVVDAYEKYRMLRGLIE